MIRPILFLIGCLPQSAVEPLSWFLGSIIYRLMPRRRRIAVRNISQSLGMGKVESKRLARRSFIHMVRVGFEVIRLPRILSKIRDLFVVEGENRLREACGKAKGALVLVSHLGNWEYGAAWMAATGLPVAMVVRPPSSRVGRRYIENVRQKAGIETISRQGGLPGIVRALKAGKWVLVAMDQHTSKNDVTVEFFGRPARTVNVAAILALRYGVPLVPAFTWREGSRFRGEILPNVEVKPSGNTDDDIRETTQRITDKIEQMIRKHPDQWLWMHRRWR